MPLESVPDLSFIYQLDIGSLSATEDFGKLWSIRF